ncbi:NUDIX hydrolase [Algihabitans albus]|uniref:NUDIX hydrolase n=1 Tax=Algihabitans albus TaxID=2164067 RepID=UPI000E5CE6AA|nr:NUDIX hydrolase [Algihabitans albus]
MTRPPDRPVLAALAVAIRGPSVVLIKRRNPPDAGLWGFAGGKVDLGETVAAAAERELREETGVEAEALESLGALDIIGRSDEGTLTHHFVLVPVLCRYRNGEPRAADDALEAKWFEIASLDPAALPMSRDVVPVAREAARRLAHQG